MAGICRLAPLGSTIFNLMSFSNTVGASAEAGAALNARDTKLGT